MNKHVTVFGATGDMGRNIILPLLPAGTTVTTCSSRSTPEEISAAFTADILIFSVPQSVAVELLRGCTLQSDQLVIDICSYKQDLPTIVQDTGAAHLCLHPMNGPFTPWTRQKWITVGDVPNTNHAQWFLGLLEQKKVMMHSVATAAEHDALMAMVLGLPEFITVFLSRYLSTLSTTNITVAIADALKIGSPAFASLMKTYIHTVRSTPLWLRKELLMDIDPAFIAHAKQVCAELSQGQFYEQVEDVLRAQESELESIGVSDELTRVVREYVTNDFDLMNTVFLGEGLQSNDDLYIQKTCTANDILIPGKTVKVGIHGIHGAFTDEAWHRFATEELGLSPDQYEIIECTHSENVLRAVETGEVDRGIFAFANSGSGGYTSSIEAMGHYQYTLLASFTMPINMCILALPEVSSVHDVTTFYGHPIALSQCRKTLTERWPDTPVEACTDEMDTALSAKLLAEGELPPTTGVFASRRAAQMYNLQVLEEAVHHDPSNATAFAIVQKST